MSGGHFDYQQYNIEQIANEVEQLIITNNSTEKDVFGNDKGFHYGPETIEEFKIGLEYLRKAAIYTQRIDWLVSGDDGEDTFHDRLQKELKKVE